MEIPWGKNVFKNSYIFLFLLNDQATHSSEFCHLYYQLVPINARANSKLNYPCVYKNSWQFSNIY